MGGPSSNGRVVPGPAIMNEQSESAPTSSYVPRYASLPDYVNVLRRYWLTIAVITVAGAVIGIGWAATKSTVYEAIATLSLRDIAQDASLVGPEQTPELPPAVRAAVNAELVTRPEVSRRGGGGAN